MSNADLLEEFKRNASQASYHQAADSGGEWRQAEAYESRCKEIWTNADDALKEEIRKVANSYLIDFWRWGK